LEATKVRGLKNRQVACAENTRRGGKGGGKLPGGREPTKGKSGIDQRISLSSFGVRSEGRGDKAISTIGPSAEQGVDPR